MKITKRDGTLDELNIDKIKNAVTKAAESVNQNVNLKLILEYCNKRILKLEKISVTEIQNIVEDELMNFNHDIARSYIEYRNKRDLMRDSKSELTNNIQGLMNKTDEKILNENANKDGKIIPTQRDLLAGIVAKHYALKTILPKEVSDAHISGDIHYHDLDYSPFFPMFNCMLIDLEFMLTNGFKLGNAQITSPKSINTACAVTAQIIAQVASHIYGGNTINGIDTILSKYVEMTHLKNINAELEKSNEMIENGLSPIPDLLIEKFAMKKTKKDTYDAFQGLEYEINTLHCANGQTPFTTLGFGLGTTWSSRLIQKAILQVRIDGLGENKHTAIFPKLVFAIKKGVNFNNTDPNYDIKQKALECSSKRMYPDILNYKKNVEITGSFKYPMGCRSFLDKWCDESGKEIHAGRNNVGVVSLNLPRIAIEAKKDKDLFFKILDDKLSLAYKALWTRINSLNGVKANVAPILFIEGAMGVKLNENDEVSVLFKNGRASVSLGYIGMNEVANAMFKNKDHTYDLTEKQDFIRDVFKALSDKVESWKEKTGYSFSLYATPSESLCDRLCSLDKKKFGLIEGVTDKGYYTNSFHLDVEKKVNPYEKILFESKYIPFTSGGHISYGEYPNMKNNLSGLENVWDFSYDYVPYYATNTPLDICHECGCTEEFTPTSKGYQCPKCGNTDPKKMNVIRRVCGYLGEPSSRPFIHGKSEEVKRRVKHI